MYIASQTTRRVVQATDRYDQAYNGGVYVDATNERHDERNSKGDSVTFGESLMPHGEEISRLFFEK
jgi:hypothetical protein